MPFFSADSITFHYLDIGQGIPFLFQHGLGGDVHQTEDVFVPALPFRLLTLDCRGHGETRPLGDSAQLTFIQFADDLLAFLDRLNLQEVVVGGISMGAGVALNFALRHPHRVKALVLARPAWLYEPLPSNLQVYPRIAELIRRVGAEQGHENFRQTREYLELQQTFPQTALSLLRQFVRPHAEEYVAVLERLPADAPNRSPQDWSELRVPTLILANEQDPVHPFQYAEVLAQAIPNARLVQITPKEIDPHQHNRDIQQAVERFLLTVLGT